MVAPSAPSAGSRGAERSRGPGRCLRLLCCAPPCASAPSLPSLRPPLTPGSMEVMEGPLNLVSGSQRVAPASAPLPQESGLVHLLRRPSVHGARVGRGWHSRPGGAGGRGPQRLRAKPSQTSIPSGRQPRPTLESASRRLRAPPAAGPERGAPARRGRHLPRPEEVPRSATSTPPGRLERPRRRSGQQRCVVPGPTCDTRGLRAEPLHLGADGAIPLLTPHFPPDSVPHRHPDA